MDVYRRLLDHFGPRGWWPAKSPFEVAVGAILVQSVAWQSASRAIANLEAAGYLDPHRLDAAGEDEIARLIVPSLYYRQKAKKLKAFTGVLVREYGGDMARMLAGPTDEVRRRLLAIHGIGAETSDAILLYAGDHPIFVVDAYTRRIFARMGVWDESITYEEMQRYFEERLPRDLELYNEYHALIDGVGNRYCAKRRPRCGECPLQEICRYGREERAPGG